MNNLTSNDTDSSSLIGEDPVVNKAVAKKAMFLSFFISAALLSLEVSLTRIFSVVLWYHFGFMIVSLAMLGFALAGALVYVMIRRRGIRYPFTGIITFTTAAIILPSVIAITRVQVDLPELMYSLSSKLTLAMIALITVIPFCFLGYSLCATFELGKQTINKVYGCSFLGGAVGVILALAGMEYLGGGGGVILAAVAAWLSGCRSIKQGRAIVITAVLSLTVIVISYLAAPGIVSEKSQKHFPRVSQTQVIDREWNAFSSVVFFDNPNLIGLWAMPMNYTGALPEMIGVAIDEWAITSILKFDGDLSKLRFFESYPPTLGWETAAENSDVLIIGAGGGLDVLSSLYYKASNVTAVEINPLIVDAVKGRFREFSGDLYHRSDVTAIAAEGRHFLESDDNLYDRIVLTGVDTFAATGGGAYALSENYLYTVEAFETCLSRLKPGGMICMTRWFYDPPRQTLRLIAAAEEAMKRRGIKNPRDGMFLAEARLSSLILLKNDPFTEDETRRLVDGCKDRVANVLYAKGFKGHPVIEEFLTDEGRAKMESDYPYSVSAPTDDSPFLFEHAKWKNLFKAEQDMFMDKLGGQEIIVITFLSILACLICGLFIIRLFRGKEAKTKNSHNVLFRKRIFAYLTFLFLGMGYLISESILLPKLILPLGYPVYAMSVALVGLLIWSGIGSICAQRIPSTGRMPAVLCFVCAIAVPLFFNFIIDGMSQSILHASFIMRVLSVLILIAVPGFLMGMPFPLAIRALGEKDASVVPKGFLWNGAGSALACPIAIALAITFGFNNTILFAAALYLIAGIFLLNSRSSR